MTLRSHHSVFSSTSRLCVLGFALSLAPLSGACSGSDDSGGGSGGSGGTAGHSGAAGSAGNTCVPVSCTARGKDCGSLDDGCGKKSDCGTCAAPNLCGANGSQNVCGCVPT